jgi:DNA uptake protein ComE-like DNA-binding protein
VDLNQATREELADLPGLGEADAERIVAGRPYTFRDDLLQRGIVTPAQFERFAHRVYVGRSPDTHAGRLTGPEPREPGD